MLFASNSFAQTVIYKNSFTSSPLDTYTLEQLNKEWNSPSWDSGIGEGRATIVEEENSNKALEISYRAGHFSNSYTGAQWQYEFKQYEELYSSYRIKFGKNFDFVKGGKLPGFAGGTSPTGGADVSGTDGWSGRIMWRSDGRVVQYVYHPDKPGKYGEDFPWNCSFKPGTWHTIQNRFVMNTPGKYDGIIQAWFDGKLVLDKRDMRFRDVDSFGIDLFYFSTFFGGGDDSWSTSKDETVMFDDFKFFLLEPTKNFTKILPAVMYSIF